MFDTAAIAARIREERKLTKRLSQEAMVADIGLHRADVKKHKQTRTRLETGASIRPWIDAHEPRRGQARRILGRGYA